MTFFRLIALLAAVVGFVGCESGRSLSSVQDDHTAYAISGAEAKRIADDSLANYVPAAGISRGPQQGIAASGHLAEGPRTQLISITALPVTGVNAAGRIKDGYGFVVKDKGDVVNEMAPRMILGLAKQQAAIVGEVLATAKPGQE